jgi:hypothetical protein
MAEITETNPKGAGAPVGHTNSSKNNRIWGNIIKKLAVQENHRRLHVIAESLFEKAAEGDLGAIKEIGDRLDGKAVATTEIGGIDGADIPLNIGIKFVSSK